MNTNVSLYNYIDDAKKRFYEYKQIQEDDNETHLRAFKINSNVVEHYKGNMYGDKALIQYKKEQDKKNVTTHTNSEIKAIVKDKMIGTALIKRSDMSRHGPLLVDIRDQFGFGTDVYPKILAAGHDMLEDYARSRILYPKKMKPKNSHDKSKPEPKSKES